jgi:hypothetical protein
LEGAFCVSFVPGFVHGRPWSRRLVGAAVALDPGCQCRADDQFRERICNLAVRLQVGWTYCFIVNATSACPMRLLSAFQSIFASRPAVV